MRQEIIYMANHWQKCLVCLLVLVILLTPFVTQGAVVPIKSLPLGRLVENSPAELRSLGCSRLILDTTNSTVAVPAGQPFYVTSRDDPNQHFACSREASTHLQVIPGEVKGDVLELTGALVISPVAAAAWSVNWLTEALTGTSIVDRVVEGVSGTVKGYVNRQAAATISLILMVVNRLGLWFIDWTGNMFVWIMVYDRFGDSTFVQTGWPFIQGLANIGFILALLFMALSMVLRLDIGGGVRRLLPRLLLVALLVNFSLLIGVLLIDMSRIVMAALVFMLGDINPRSLSAMIIKNSSVYQSEFIHANKIPILMSDAALTEAQKDGLAGPWILVMNQAASMLLVWMMTFAFIVLSFAFAIRYVILLILLTISPLAYLAVALPGAKGMVDKYWKTFMKWVLFGPAAVLLLVLITKVGTFDLVPDNADKANVFEHISHLVIVAIMIYTAIFAGNYVGGVGGAMSVNFAKGLNSRVRRGAVRGGKLGAKGLYVGTGARFVRRQAGDAGRVFRKGVRDIAKRIPFVRGAVPVKRDERGRPLQGQRSWLQRGAEAALGASGVEAKSRDRYRRRREMKAAPATPEAVTANRAYDAGNLGLREVGETINNRQMKAVVTHAVKTQDLDRLQELVRNPHAVDNMGSDLKIEIGSLSGKSGGSFGKLSSDEENKLERKLRELKRSLRRSVEETDSERWG